MSSVATQLIATTMNSNLGVQESTFQAKESTSRNFSSYYNQAKDSKSLDKTQYEGRKQKRISQNSIEEDGNQYENNTKTVLNEQSEKLTSEKNSKEDLDVLKEEVLETVSEKLGISVDELETMLDEMTISVFQLLNIEVITEIVGETLDIKEFGELLTHSEAFTVIKDIMVGLEEVMESLNLDKEAIRLMTEKNHEQGTVETLNVDEEVVKLLAQENGKQSELTEMPKEENAYTVDSAKENGSLRVEVNDTRSHQDTGEKQNDSAFTNLLSQGTQENKTVVSVSTDQIQYKQVSTEDVIDQIVSKAIINLSDEKTSIQLQLNPEHLGKIAVSISSEQGVVKGYFIAENQTVKEMIEANLVQLKEQLEEQGIKVEKIEVTIGNSNQYFDQKKSNQEQQFAKRSKKNQRNNKLSVGNIEELETINATDVQSNRNIMMESTVEYSA